jgi:HAL2 family 3'(2'),5'-bisphosphate nucleotidase
MGSYEAELQAAIEAVRSAARVCRAVQKRLVSAETLEKKDKSPVTVADFASQAIVCERLARVLPNDAVVGEEGSAELRQDDQASLRDAVVREVTSEMAGSPDAAQVLEWIDRGGADASSDRYWTLDPIDGTKGFLRGQHYAVALGLLEKGQVVVGVLGCPNMDDGNGNTGALFTAVKGGGARAMSLFGEEASGKSIQVSQISDTSEARFCESVESGHSNQDQSAQIASELGISSEPFRIDSQCKYAAIARADASIYLRMPTRKDYREKIWDHAAGKLVVEEAGGTVTDVEGNPLDFTQGKTLDSNRGVVATCGPIHDRVIEVVRKVRASAS